MVSVGLTKEETISACSHFARAGAGRSHFLRRDRWDESGQNFFPNVSRAGQRGVGTLLPSHWTLSQSRSPLCPAVRRFSCRRRCRPLGPGPAAHGMLAPQRAGLRRQPRFANSYVPFPRFATCSNKFLKRNPSPNPATRTRLFYTRTARRCPPCPAAPPAGSRRALCPRTARMDAVTLAGPPRSRRSAQANGARLGPAGGFLLAAGPGGSGPGRGGAWRRRPPSRLPRGAERSPGAARLGPARGGGRWRRGAASAPGGCGMSRRGAREGTENEIAVES